MHSPTWGSVGAKLFIRVIWGANLGVQAMFELNDRVVAVTGGLGQLGRAFVEALIGAGAKVAVLDRAVSNDALRSAFSDLAASDRIAGISCDVTDKDSLKAALAQIRDRLGEPYGLVNNAALDSPPDAPASETGPFETYPELSWNMVMDVNVKGVFLSSQVFGAAMAAAGRGSIVNIGSIYGVVAPDQGIYQYRRDRGEEFFKPVAYSASKSSLYNFTRYLAAYFGNSNVRANILTFAGVYNGQDETFLEGYGRKIPLDRGQEYAHLHKMASPDDYCGPVVFLMSNASAYMTGADLRIDGGYTAL